MPVVTIDYAIVALLRLIVLSLWLIRLDIALQLSLTLASFCAPDESRRTKKVIIDSGVATGLRMGVTTLLPPD